MGLERVIIEVLYVFLGEEKKEYTKGI